MAPRHSSFGQDGRVLIDNGMNPYHYLYIAHIFSEKGLSQTAIEAAAKAEQEHPTINVIEQTEDTYKITRRSRMIDATKTYKIGQETTETAKSGDKKVIVTADTNCVRTITSMPADRQLIDTRRIVDNGSVMTFRIELLTPTAKVNLMRYFDRQQPKPVSLLVDEQGVGVGLEKAL